MERPDVYCQNCRSQNSLRDTHCQQCGTRLLLVVFPQSLQYDTNHVPSFYEDHLLERVSLLELRLVQMSESLRIAMEIIREQGKIVKENQQQVRLLHKKLENQAVSKKPGENPRMRNAQSPEIESIIAEHDSPNIELFTKLLGETVRMLAQNDEKEAFRMMERAALLSPRNVPLFVFAARTHFFADKYADAKKYLEKAFELAPDDLNVLFFLGIIYADEGEAEKARLFLSLLAENEATSLVVNFIWGMLAAYGKNWNESIAAFKVAAERGESAEIFYLLGCAFFELHELSDSLRYFEKANSIDPHYTDSWFMQAVIYDLQNDHQTARQMLQQAAQARESAAQATEYLRKNKLSLAAALPFQHFGNKNARLLSGGALRLARFLKNEIGRAVNGAVDAEK